MQRHLISVGHYGFKIVRDGLPGVVASVGGAIVISYLHWGGAIATPPAAPVAPVASALSDTQVARMIKDEHTLIVDFLKQQQQASRKADDSARAASAQARADAAAAKLAAANAPKEPVKEAAKELTREPLKDIPKVKVATAVQPSLPAPVTAPVPVAAPIMMPVAVAAPVPVVAPAPVVAAVPPLPAPIAVATFESGPLVAPGRGDVESDPTAIRPPADIPGVVDKTAEASRIRGVAGFVLDIPSRVGRTLVNVLPSNAPAPSQYTEASW